MKRMTLKKLQYEFCKSSYQGCKLRTKINILGLITKLDGVKCRKKSVFNCGFMYELLFVISYIFVAFISQGN